MQPYHSFINVNISVECNLQMSCLSILKTFFFNFSGRKYAMLKLKVLLSSVLRNYRILSDLTEKDFKLKADIILKRTDGFRIQIEPRVRQSINLP